MKNQQGKYIVGYVHIKILGKNPEMFLQYCIENHFVIWDIEKIEKNVCKATIYLSDLNKLEQFIETMPYELKITKPKGLLPSIKDFWNKKELVITIGICISLLFILSNIAWKLEIDGVSMEIDIKIREQLASEGLYEGAWTTNLTDLDQIQQTLLANIPELLYIGIQKKGTTYHVDAIEKLQEKETTKPSTQHLVATKAGVIQKIFVKSGISKVEIHDLVNKGDMLVSGIIDVSNENDEETENKKKEIAIPAEGEVYANTWYEVNISSPLYTKHEKLSGENYESYQLKFDNSYFPIWGFRNPYSNYITDEEMHYIQLFQKKFPIALMKKTYYDETTVEQSRTKQDAIEIAIKYLRKDLQLKLGSDAEILNYKVLHEREENGKVKMNLYISVLENIAKEKKFSESFNIKGSQHE